MSLRTGHYVEDRSTVELNGFVYDVKEDGEVSLAVVDSSKIRVDSWGNLTKYDCGEKVDHAEVTHPVITFDDWLGRNGWGGVAEMQEQAGREEHAELVSEYEAFLISGGK